MPSSSSQPAQPTSDRGHQNKWTVVLIAHGTVSHIDELPDFVREIRRGRPAPPGLIDELRHRYEIVGGSPLLEWTQKQAAGLQKEIGLPTRVAMRLWNPRIGDVLSDLPAGARVCLVPMAPFSVSIYEAAAQQALADTGIVLVAVAPWGEQPAILDAWAQGIRETAGDSLQAADSAVILTAHSLPKMVIDRGDKYAEQFESAAKLVAARLGTPARIAYQSQGATDAEWLGPTLLEQMTDARARGARRVVIAPIGFLAEHIETLFDLDHEALAQAKGLGLELIRVPTLGDSPGLISAMASAVQEKISQWTPRR